MGLHGEGFGGVVFLVLYSINFSILSYGFITKRISFGSVYTILLIHVVLRLAAQSVAIALGAQNPEADFNVGLLITFFVLAAEGYFSLVLCAYRFLVQHHQDKYPIDGSWLEGKRSSRKDGQDISFWTRFARSMTARDSSGKKDPWMMSIIHWILLAANVVIIVGGTQVNASDYLEPNFESLMTKAKIMRAVGQSIFLLINSCLAIFLFLTVRQDRSLSGTLPRGWTRIFRVQPDHGAVDAANRTPSRKINRTLLILILAWPPLIIRGVFGLLQSLISEINYSNPAAYKSFAGFTNTFIIMENVFSVLPEWTACCILCTTMFTRDQRNHAQVKAHEDRAASADTISMDPLQPSWSTRKETA